MAPRLPAALLPIVLVLAPLALEAAQSPDDARPTQPAPARVVMVRPMQDLDAILPHVAPGTIIEFAGGTHRPGVVRGLRGTAEKPIVLRGPRSGLAATIGGGAVGLHLIDVEHIVVDGIVFRDQRQAAIVVAGDQGRTSNVTLRGVRVLGSAGDGAHGVVIDGATSVSISDTTILNWAHTAIHVHESTRVAMTSCRLIAFGHRIRPYGVRVGGGSTDIVIDRLSCEHRVGVAIALGESGDALADAGLEGNPPADASRSAASRIEVSDTLVLGAATAWRLQNASDVDIRRCTVAHVTRAVFEFGVRAASERLAPQSPPHPSLSIHGCLFDWSKVPNAAPLLGSPSTAVTLGANLWFGGDPERTEAAIRPLKEAPPIRGGGDDSQGKQTVDVDPQTDPLGRSEVARGLGFGSRHSPTADPGRGDER